MSLYDSASLYDNGTTFDGYPAGLSTQPVVGVFIAFDDGAYVAEPNWVEVTQFVREINVRRGRGDDLQNFPSGTANVTLDNRLRLFDPFNTAGVYYGKLKPRRQIKIVGQWAGVNYPMFRGYVAGWPVGETDAGKDSTVQLDCFDALALLAADQSPNDWVTFYTRQASPSLYWKCNDSQGTTVLAEQIVGSAFQMTAVSGTPTFFEVNSLAQGLVNNAVYCRLYQTPGVSNTTPTTQIFSFWARINTGASGSGGGISFQSYQARFSISQNATSLSFGFIGLSAAAAREFRVTSEFTPALGVPFHVTVYASSSSPTIFINNVQVAYTTISPGGPNLGGPDIRQVQVVNAEVSEIAWWLNGSLSDAQRTAIYNAGVARFTETTSQRVTRLLDKIGFPESLRNISTATSGVVSAIGAESSTTGDLNVVDESENGELYVDESGVITFLGRDYLFNLTRCNTSQITFTDTGVGVGYSSDGLSFAFDADKVRNDVSVTFTGGGNKSAVDSVSVNDVGIAAENVSTYLATPEQAQILADNILRFYKELKLRVDPFSVNGGRDPSYSWPLLLSLELLDRFTFKRSPTVGSVIEQDMLLQSVEHRVTPNSWVTTVNGSARYTGWFTVGVSLLGGTDVLL